MKKAFLLWILLLSSCFVMAEKVFVDGIYYNLISENTAEVTYNGDEEDGWMYFSPDELYVGDVVVPASFVYDSKFYQVTTIGESAFAGSKNMYSLTLPASISTIKDAPFSLCLSLSSINVSSENELYFSQNGILYERRNNRVSIFFVPRNIQGDVELNERITTIPSSAFQSTNITTITIPENVTSIGDGAFYNCQYLSEIFFNQKVKTIGVQAFGKCNSLMIVTIPESVEKIEKSAFLSCSNLIYPIFKEGLVSIGEMAFYDCGNIVAVNLPSTLQSIGNKAFDRCENLKQIQNNSSLVLTAGSDENGSVAKYVDEIIQKEEETVLSDFLLNIISSDCGSLQAEFDINTVIEYDSLLWDLGDGNYRKNVERFNYTYQSSGVYSPIVYLWKNKKETKVTKEYAVNVKEIPSAKFSYENSDFIVPASVVLINESTFSNLEKLQYEWYVDDKILSSEKNFVLNENERGFRNVLLKVIAENGCEDVYEEDILIKNEGEFEFVDYESCQHDEGEETCEYRIGDNTLIVYGKIESYCGGDVYTAEIIDKGDTLEVKTYRNLMRNITTCMCLFDYEISIPNFYKESCVVVFNGKKINVGEEQTSVSEIKNDSFVKIRKDADNHNVIIKMSDENISDYTYDIISEVGKKINGGRILRKTTVLNFSASNGIYFIRVYKDGELIAIQKILN
ncbi:MAG: leucine-rich repeat domain-containing protein [Bacteroidales bacterium]|nr:leucine-rich repeat domain-containing protein [Bacteroidales bacterium]